VRVDNPLRRSGFVLAGANNALQKERSSGNDGIVTAEEILGLDLRGTDLVFLSNRDTGTGDGSREEALLALRQAFFRAGTRSLVVALWSPPDEEALELVTRFYENLRAGGTDRCEALRQAALKQMAAVRTRYGHAHPLYWGGYIFLGQP
jgi:CHAT domain-containing protein